ncbi:MAG: hypothetical protein JKY52_09105 [Flavobacteriales bacterium]|nr:hypothetical protein [Flavobacteriales bacterium]
MTDQLYCPICTNELDKNGDCWVRCEYESDGAPPEYSPLTNRQALERRIAESKSKQKKYRGIVKHIKSEIFGYENELNQL